MWIRLLLLVVLVLVGLAGSFVVASESGEVVVLRTRDAAGETHETRLWVVDHAGFAWLRTGNPQSEWLARVRANPEVEVIRDGRPKAYRAVPASLPATRDQINALILQKYGWAEDYLRTVMLEPSHATPVRLEPR